jgi:hypothetical protein
MKKHALLAAAILVAGSLVAANAAPKDDVIAAAKKLAESSYSWKSTTDSAGGFGGGPTEGKIDKTGLILVSLTMRDNTLQIAKQGGKAAVKGEEGWQSADDASQAEGPGRFMGMMAQGLTAPGAQAQDLAAQAADLKLVDGAYAGTLTEDAAKSVVMPFRFPGPDAPAISGAEGSVRFWIKDGVLAKFELKVKGKFSFNGNDRDVDRTTTTEFTDIGTTTVSVPEDAKKKLL